MKRSPLRRSTGEAKTSVPILKQRKCANCREPFRPFSSLVKWCSPECGSALAVKKLEKAKAKEAAEDKRKTRAQLEALKTRSDWIKDAQQAFNRYVRLRDAGKPCICCGLPLEAGAVGGGYDCGHYRSVGSAPHLRFDERNAHGQRKQCNRYGAGRAVDYRLGLLVRLGADVVEALEADQGERKWSIAELKEIRDTYRAKARELEKQQ
jgi:hypothetical protein